MYGSKGGEYYCESCYLTLFGKKCAGCEKVGTIFLLKIFYFILLQVILGEGLRFGEQNYHRVCFKCAVCDQALAQGAAHSIKVGSSGETVFMSVIFIPRGCRLVENVMTTSSKRSV